MTQTPSPIILRKKASGVGILLIDCPGKVNLLKRDVMHELGRVLDSVKTNPEIKALVVLSGKPDSFLLGADLHEIIKITSESQAYQMSRQGQEILAKISKLGKPCVVGIHGLCLGGGLELALWCQYRIATTDPSTMLGLPEVRLGIVPGLGGTQLLPRLIGAKAALEIVLSSEPISAMQAKDMGLVDELVAPDDLLSRLETVAVSMVCIRGTAEGQGQTPALMPGCIKGEVSLESEKQDKLFAMADRSVRIKTKGNYPAHTRVIQLIRAGLSQSLEIGLELEAKTFGELAVSAVARNLQFLFFSSEYAKRGAALLAWKKDDSAVGTIGIIGGGTMGLAIAQAAVLAGFDVLLKEVNKEKLDQAMAMIKSSFQRIGTKSKCSVEDMEAFVRRVQPVVADSMLTQADLVIEAVFEDINTKTDVFCRLAEVVRPDCILATNTSSLSVSAMANRIPRSERFLGLHFFHPVDKMPLVEVILHESCDRDVSTKATAFVSRLGKTPVSVSDGPGFLVNRLLCCYLLEAARVAEEGTPLNWIEDAAQQFGMPMGPLTLLDEVGLDVAFQVARSLYEGCGQRFAPPSVLGRLQGLGLAGKKGGKGIYMWDESGKRLAFNQQLTAELNLVISEDKPDLPTSASISERLVLPMVDEAARCLAEKVVRRARELDLAMVMGIGFPAFRGGPLRYADKLSIPEFRKRLERIYEKTMPVRTVSDLVKTMESSHRSFYVLNPDKEVPSDECGH